MLLGNNNNLTLLRVVELLVSHQLLVSVFLLVGFCGLMNAQAVSPSDERDIQNAVQQMLKASGDQDWDAFAKLWIDPTRFPELAAKREDLPLLFTKPNQNIDLRFSTVRVNGNNAWVRAYFRNSPIDPQSQRIYKNQVINVALNKVNGSWKIARVAGAVRDFMEFFITRDSETERRSLFEQEQELLTVETVKESENQADSALRQGNSDRALRLFQFMARTSDRLRDSQSNLRSRLGICNARYQLPLSKETLPSCQSALELAIQTRNNQGISEAWMLLGYVYWKKGSLITAERFFDQSIKLGERIGYNYGIAWSGKGLGELAANAGDYQRAVQYHRKALGAFEQIKDTPEIAWSYYELASAYYELRADSDAVREYEQSLSVYSANQFLGMMNLYWAGHAYSNLGKFDSALESYKRSLSLAQAIESTRKDSPRSEPSLYDIYSALGALFQEKNDSAKALENYSLAIEHAKIVSDKRAQAQGLLSRGDIYDSDGKPNLAVEDGRKAIELLSGNDDKAQLSMALDKLASFLDDDDKHPEAEDSFRRSVDLAEEAFSKPSTDKLVARDWLKTALSDWGLSCLVHGQYRGSLELLNRRRQLEKQGGEGETIETSVKIGAVYLTEGSQANARQWFDKAFGLATTDGDRAAILFAFGNTYEAETNYAEATKYYSASLMAYKRDNDTSGILRSGNKLAMSLWLQGKRKDAIDILKSISNLATRTSDIVELAQTQLTLGRFQTAVDDNENALKSFRSSYEVLKNHDVYDGMWQALLYEALSYNLLAKNDEALQSLHEAGLIAQKTKIAELSWVARGLEGVIYGEQNRLPEARQALSEAIDSIEKLRINVAGGEQDQIAFFSKRVLAYHAMVSVLLKQGDLRAALEYCERSKARMLTELLKTRAVASPSVNTNDRLQTSRLQGRVAALNLQLLQEKQRYRPNNAINVLSSKLATARMEVVQFQAQTSIAQATARENGSAVKPFELADAEHVIKDENTVLLQYVVDDDAIYLLTLSRTAKDSPIVIKGYTLPVAESHLKDRIQNFRERILRRSNNFRSDASDLFRMLMNVAQADLAAKLRLIIVPDGVLWYLPFQALQSSNGHYLVEDFSISYAPSIAALAEMAKQRSEASLLTDASRPLVLAMGNPGSTLPHRNVSQTQCTARADLGDIPESEVEATEIVRAYGGSKTGSIAYTRQMATSATLRREAAKYKILHLATHAILDNASPMDSYLVLASEPNSGSMYASLSAREVTNLNLHAELVVLSSCESAGSAGAGEGLMGMAWALAAGGTPTVVASQWKVDSCSTTNLMIEFHRRFKDRILLKRSNVNAATALREAQLALMKSDSFQHPFYWAGFIVVGDGR